MRKYKYALIDMSWICYRNYCAMGGRNGTKVPDYFPQALVASVTTSILNACREFLIDKIVQVWDFGPYYKQQILNNTYKAGRYKPTEEEAAKIEDEQQKEIMLADAYNFTKKNEAQSILMGLSELGLPSIYKPGYEADDLVYILGKMISDKGDTAIICSVDSDWDYWIHPGIDHYNPNRNTIKSYEESCEENGIGELSLFEFKALYDSIYGSHNALLKTIKDEHYDRDCHEIFDIVNSRGFTEDIFEYPDLALAQYKSFQFDQLPDYNTLPLLYEYMEVEGQVPSQSFIAKFGVDRLINFNTSAFSHYLKTLNPKLFKE